MNEERGPLQRLIDYCDDKPHAAIELLINSGIFQGENRDTWDASEEIVYRHLMDCLEHLDARKHDEFDKCAGRLLKFVIGGMQDANG